MKVYIDVKIIIHECKVLVVYFIAYIYNRNVKSRMWDVIKRNKDE